MLEKVMASWRRAPMVVAFAAWALLALTACFEEEEGGADAGAADGGAPDAGPVSPVRPLVRYDGAALYDAPFPDERLRRDDGIVDLSSFPNPRRIRIVDQILGVLEGADGFGRSSPVHFPLDGPIDSTSLPTLDESVAAGASVFVMDVDPDSSERGQRYPVDVAFRAEGGAFGAPNMLSVLPLQGWPLQPSTRYAFVVTRAVVDRAGRALEAGADTAALLAGERPPGLSDAAYHAHREAIDALAELGVGADTIAAMAVIRTWDPELGLRAATARLAAEAPLALESAFEPAEVFDTYCVFRATVRVPVFQAGTPPYSSEGGGWAYDAAGELLETDRAESAVWVTLPRTTMPAEGFPTTVFVRTGGGGDRPLVDRGVRAEAGGPSIEAGSGPARELARAGFAGVSVDGPLGGLRNPSDWDEQFAIFNIGNPLALRDNIRQSALELTLLPRLVEALEIDASSCPGLEGPARLDASRLALMGHSMGATIAPLTMAVEPAYGALLLSGAGGSWIMNIMYKERPVDVRPLAESLLRYRTGMLHDHDPILGLLQWAGEPADPQLYANRIVETPSEGGARRHVLMMQGILDTYIPPAVANALSLPLGVDLGGPRLDETLVGHPPLTPLLTLRGRSAATLPIESNRFGEVTAVVTQHEQDDVEDGHEVVFQLEAPKRQYRCFLSSWLDAVPRVPGGGAGDDCD